MDLINKRIIFAAHYAAGYLGNFMTSLMSLESMLLEIYNVRCAYVLPKEARYQPWIKEFSQSHQVYFTGQTLYDGIRDIVEEFDPDLIYSHFEGYDMPFYKELKHSDKIVRQVWHKHNAMVYHKNFVKALYQRWCFFKHYGVPFLCIFGGG